MLKLSFLRTLALVAISLAVTFVQAQSSASRTSDAAQKQLAGLLREPLPGHAGAQAPPSFYASDALYQYIDGGADIYLLYDFKRLLHQDFKNGATEVTVDIYEMGNIEDAFGIYAAERSPGYKFISIGAEGYRDKGILNYFEDRYYLKLSASGANADLLLDQLARLLSGRIGGSRTFPALLEKFPENIVYLIPNSTSGRIRWDMRFWHRRTSWPTPRGNRRASFWFRWQTACRKPSCERSNWRSISSKAVTACRHPSWEKAEFGRETTMRAA